MISVAGETALSSQGVSYENTQGGVEYTALHELGHASSGGQQVTNDEYSDYLRDNPEDPTGSKFNGSPQEIAAEQYANSYAKTVASTFGVNIMTQVPTYGYHTGEVQ